MWGGTNPAAGFEINISPETPRNSLILRDGFSGVDALVSPLPPASRGPISATYSVNRQKPERPKPHAR
jgi:hypothetical protein